MSAAIHAAQAAVLYIQDLSLKLDLLCVFGVVLTGLPAGELVDCFQVKMTIVREVELYICIYTVLLYVYGTNNIDSGTR